MVDPHQGLGYLRRAAFISDSPQGPADCFVGWSPEAKCRFASSFEAGLKMGIKFHRLPKPEADQMAPTEVPAKAQEKVWTCVGPVWETSQGLRNMQVWDRA